MSAQPQQNIRAYLNSSVKRAFAEAKVALKEEGKKKIQELKAQIPTPDVILKKMRAASCHPKVKEKIEKIYNFLHKIISKIVKILQKVSEFFSRILEKFNKIKEKVLKKISNPGDSENPGILDKLILPIEILQNIIRIVPITLKALPAPPPGVPGFAGLIATLNEQKKKGEDKVGIYIAVITGFVSTIRRQLEKVEKIETIIASIRSSVDQFKDRVNQILLYLEYLYLMFFTDCNYPGEQIDPDTGDVIEVTAEDILLADSESNLANLTDNISYALKQYHEALALEGKKEITERIYALKFDIISQDFTIDYKKSYKVKLISPF